jgi:hypothetical protein
MNPRLIFTIFAIVIILAAGLVIALSWRPVTAGVAKLYYDFAAQSGLVGYWNFDDCNDCTSAIDRSGKGNTGTMYVAASTVGNLHTGAGKIRNGISLDGSNDYIDVANESNFDFERTDPFTLSVWVYPTRNATIEGILSKLYHGSPYNGSFEIMKIDAPEGGSGVANGLRVSLISNWDAGNAIQVDTTTALTLNTWTHIAVTYNGSSAASGVKIFLNGSQDTLTTRMNGLAGSTLNNLSVKISTRNTLYPFAGRMDEVRIYDRELSVGEIQRLYEQGALAKTVIKSGLNKNYVNMPQNNLLTDGLVGHWSFNGQNMDWGQASAEARDSGGGGNHGNVTNFDKNSVRPGIVGQALSFNLNTADSVDLPGAILNGIGANGSIALWFKLDRQRSNSSTAQEFLYESEENAIRNQLRLYWEPNEGQLQCGKNYSNILNVVESVFSVQVVWNVNTWYHLVCVWNGTTMRIYVNGSQDNSAGVTSGLNSTANVAKIGNHRLDSVSLGGIIDEFRIYNRALSAAEIAQLYAAGRRE